MDWRLKDSDEINFSQEDNRNRHEIRKRGNIGKEKNHGFVHKWNDNCPHRKYERVNKRTPGTDKQLQEGCRIC